PITLLISLELFIFCRMYLPLFIMKKLLSATSLYRRAFPSRLESSRSITLSVCFANGDGVSLSQDPSFFCSACLLVEPERSLVVCSLKTCSRVSL
ncbi:hypothetical protein VIGAN_04221800, partial [Vigna angularis var. angularis]